MGGTNPAFFPTPAPPRIRGSREPLRHLTKPPLDPPQVRRQPRRVDTRSLSAAAALLWGGRSQWCAQAHASRPTTPVAPFAPRRRGAGALPGLRRAASARDFACPGWRGSFPAADTACPSCTARASRRRRCAATPFSSSLSSHCPVWSSPNSRYSAHCGCAARANCGYAAPVPDGTATRSFAARAQPNAVLGTPNPRTYRPDAREYARPARRRAAPPFPPARPGSNSSTNLAVHQPALNLRSGAAFCPERRPAAVGAPAVGLNTVRRLQARQRTAANTHQIAGGSRRLHVAG